MKNYRKKIIIFHEGGGKIKQSFPLQNILLELYTRFRNGSGLGTSETINKSSFHFCAIFSISLTLAIHISKLFARSFAEDQEEEKSAECL